MKIICELIAGSRLYGLETTESDYDTRGIFINTDYKKIIGLEKQDILKKSSEDYLFFELNHYLKSLIKTNTKATEILFAEVFKNKTEEFDYIQDNKYKLIDSEKLFFSLLGYVENEKKLANGLRKGALGGKRRNQLEKYGFSPKNFSHLLRLCFCGKHFFETDYYPVNLQKYEIRSLLYSIKTEPEKYNKNQLNELVEKSIKELTYSFDNRKSNYKFDFDFANQICLKLYSPYLTF